MPQTPRPRRPPPRSLRGRLLVLWAISLVSAVAVATLLVQLYRQSSIDQVARADAVAARGCDGIIDRYGFWATGWTGPVDAAAREGLRAVVAMALIRLPGVEGGIWQREAGPLAYAYPTYDGTGPKTDLPAAELDRIRAINADALEEDRAVALRQAGRSQTLLLHACPLPGPIEGATAWTMTRVFTAGGAGLTRLVGGLGVLGLSVLASAAWTTHLLLTWSRKLAGIERSLARHAGLDLPPLAPTGERELDRIVSSLNAATVQLGTLRAEAGRLQAQVAQSERLAALGRVAAGVAHEIRNPIAAMRLRAENALLADDARRQAALHMVLAQVARLDALLRDLLTLTHTAAPQRQDTNIPALLASVAEFHRETAEARQVALAVAPGPPLRWFIDPDRVRRALDNLVLNALQTLPPGSRVQIAARADAALHLSVADDGPGLPAAVAQHLFEPFVTARADGTGLGLSIVREIAAAHGGTAAYRPGHPGAIFTLTFPDAEP